MKARWMKEASGSYELRGKTSWYYRLRQYRQTGKRTRRKPGHESCFFMTPRPACHLAMPKTGKA